jgi:hypothetical protein
MDKKFNNSLIVGGIMLEVSSHTFFWVLFHILLRRSPEKSNQCETRAEHVLLGQNIHAGSEHQFSKS